MTDQTSVPTKSKAKKKGKDKGEMKAAAKALEFEKAAMLRDQVVELKQVLADKEPEFDLLAR